MVASGRGLQDEKPLGDRMYNNVNAADISGLCT